MEQTPPKLDLPFTYYDRTLKAYVYQRPVPPDAIWLLQKKKITNSLGKTPRDAHHRHPAIHLKWERAIEHAIASVKGDPTEDTYMDCVIDFLSAEASKQGGILPEIDWTLNWSEREKLWRAWRVWNEAINHRVEKEESWFADDVIERLDDLIIAYKVVCASQRRRMNLTMQLPAPLKESKVKTEDGQIVMSLDELREQWEAEKERSQQTKDLMKRMITLFVATCGNLAVHEITGQHRIQFREAVMASPGKAQTKNVRMKQFRALGSYAAKLGVVNSNPLEFLRFEETDVVERESFSDTILKQIFGSTAWVERSPKYREFIRWFFLIGAYTGARLGEIAQLYSDDVFEFEGHWVIRIAHDPARKQRAKGKKTRLVPVSKHLVRLGFLNLVKARQKETRNPQLFPEMKPGYDGHWSRPVSPALSKLVRDAGLSQEYVGGHGWRHTFITRLRGKVADSVAERITHPRGTGSIQRRYGSVEICEMQKAVDLLVYNVEWPKS